MDTLTRLWTPFVAILNEDVSGESNLYLPLDL